MPKLRRGACGFLKKLVGRPTNYPHSIPTSQLPKVSTAGILENGCTTESPHGNMLKLLRYSPRARLQKARNPSSNPLSQFQDGRSPHTNDAPQTRAVELYENDFRAVVDHARHRAPVSSSPYPCSGD